MSSSPSTLLATHANCLATGTQVSDFEIIGLIGEGGFGIVYLARDTSLDRIVALKEFMPAAFAGRIDGVRVAVRAANHRATFDAGLKSFINESKMLAKFAHPALVEVFRFWEGNGTAYMAMRLYRGETLRQVLSKGSDDFTEDRIAQVMGPIFDALEMLHREQVFHRDIAPDNIILSEGRSVLLDFGSARKIIGDATQALTTVLKPGYAPLEQYSDDGTMKQGAWTDVYALGGVLYHLATGKVPLQAVSRMMSDP
ncbi:MAG: serine/threonine protein kinase, partial [Rhizobacter sp.]|nr:serine/threonine protein kinase [Burkholderiales bacterium]